MPPNKPPRVDRPPPALFYATLGGLPATAQSLVHSMCWFSWDAKSRGTVRPDMSKLYDTEAHKGIPELFGELAVLRLLDKELHARA
jgi:hypothetical protein